MAINQALLDTTIQVDRKKSATRNDWIDEILANFEWKVTTSICLLEFKATLIQQCITIHDMLRSVGKYTTVRDYLTESSHPQAKLRGHIFQNLINVFAPSSFDVTEERDRKLAEKARIRLETTIPRLYKWFTKKSVDSVLKKDIECTRALELPAKKVVAFGVNIPNCRRGRNKSCHIEDFIRTRAAKFTERLEAISTEFPDEQSYQLKRTCELFRRVLNDDTVELSQKDCRRAGDCLIVLEGNQVAREGHQLVTHGLSTNATEWKTICDLIPCEFVRVQYPAVEEM